jgi:hypothetical protein
MKYPSRSEYCSAIRNPKFAFRKKDPHTKIERDLDYNLVNGSVVEKIKLDGTRDIWSASGGYAIAFKFETSFPKHTWAVRCFYRSNFEVKDHYKKALFHLKNSSCRSYFVDFSFLEEGIRVQGNCYPILKMEWVEGDNLKKFIKANLNNKKALQSLADLWIKLSKSLLEAGIAHGDLQHGNILIINHGNKLAIKLIDYDSLYFAKNANLVDDNIKGLADYQHHLRKFLNKRCLEIDFFPQLVIYLSILALAEDKKLWETYGLDEREGLLFSRLDFQNPDQSTLFRALAYLPQPLPLLASKLKKICQIGDFRELPTLDAFLGKEPSLVLTAPSVSNKAEYFSNRTSPGLPQPTSPILQWLRSNLFRPKDIPTEESATNVPLFNWKNGSENKADSHSQASKSKIIDQPGAMSPRQPLEPVVKTTSAGGGGVGWDPRRYKVQAARQDADPAYFTQAEKSLTQAKNPKILLSPAQATTWIAEKAERLLGWVDRTKQNLQKTYHSSRDHTELQLNNFISKKMRPLPILVNKVKKNFQLNSFRNVLSLPPKGRETPKNKPQSLNRYPSPLSQSLVQSTPLTNSDRGVEKKENELVETWTTPEVASLLKSSAIWCHHQRYQYPDCFDLSTHYYKDEEGMIRWTEAGITQLRCLQSQQPTANSFVTLRSTKEVSNLLGVSPQWLTKIKAKYASNFVEGTHYRSDTKRRYYWTPTGIDVLRQLHTAHPPRPPRSTTQSSSKKNSPPVK